MTLRHASPSEKLNGVLPLRQEKGIDVACHGDAEEEQEVTKVRHGELRVETGGDVLQQRRCRSSEDDVIDVQKKVGGVQSVLVDEQRHVGGGRGEAELAEVRCKTLVPGARGLLEAVE